MDNAHIADQFSLLSKLMDIHGENSFKSKSYSSAAFAIEKLPVPLSEMPPEKIAGIKGIGSSTVEKILEILKNGHLAALEEIILSTPPGVIEMLRIKGIGPKKIHSIWKEMEIESVGELLYACKENRLKLYKGFGEKTQQNVIEFIEFYLKNKDSHLYADAEIFLPQIQQFLETLYPGSVISLTGNVKRQLPVVDALEFVIDLPIADLKKELKKIDNIQIESETAEQLVISTALGIHVKLYSAGADRYYPLLLKTSSSQAFYEALPPVPLSLDSEESYFKSIHLPFIAAPYRENPSLVSKLKENPGYLQNVIQLNDIKGIIHCHSNWSDGSNSIDELANACIHLGLEYLVMSDHSKSAFYANGLSEDRVKEQHRYIDELNKKWAHFKIFKSIECDILYDGRLDYPDVVLETFDLVIASVHSNLKMTEEKAMTRLLQAISNPYTTVLGHMTGRLLLSRAGYPLNHKMIIDACAENNVVIELNANPHRLDIDWEHIEYALEQGVMISIDPDAHNIAGLQDIQYGVLVAQKAIVKPHQNLSSFSLPDMEEFIQKRKGKKPI